MKPIFQKIIIAAAVVICTAIPAALYLQTKGQPDLETFVRKGDPTATLIAGKIHACGQSTEWETKALCKAEEAIVYATDWDVWGWGSLDHRSTTAELTAQCKAQGFETLRGDCKAIAVLVASTAEHLEIPWRFRQHSGRYWGTPGHVWAEVKLNGAWYSVGAKAKNETEVPNEAAPALPSPGILKGGNNQAIADYFLLGKIPL